MSKKNDPKILAKASSYLSSFNSIYNYFNPTNKKAYFCLGVNSGSYLNGFKLMSEVACPRSKFRIRRGYICVGFRLCKKE